MGNNEEKYLENNKRTSNVLLEKRNFERATKKCEKQEEINKKKTSAKFVLGITIKKYDEE